MLHLIITSVIRRIFSHLLQSKLCVSTFKAGKSSKPEDKLKEWYSKQFSLYKSYLRTLLASDTEWLWEISLKTLMELTRTEIEHNQNKSHHLLATTLTEIYQQIIFHRKDELDADLLLLFRMEIFQYHDCLYYSMISLRTSIFLIKDELIKEKYPDLNVKNVPEELIILVQNVIDLLRMIELPETIDATQFFIPYQDKGDEEKDSDSDSDDSSVEELQKSTETKLTNNKKKRSIDTLLDGRNQQSKQKSKKAKLSASILSLIKYQKLFSKIWIKALSLPMSLSLHKTLLKHIADHVLVQLANPLLLADYLTQCYQLGGALSVLALESLFTLIAKHNLDYPHFFDSLYNLCTLNVLNAKYANKYMKLLHMALRSINLPAYFIGAFLKRLARLAMQVATPRAKFCIAEIIWLLRQHRTCQVLIHRKLKKKNAVEGVGGEIVDHDDTQQLSGDQQLVTPSVNNIDDAFRMYQDHDLDQVQALTDSSSLYELLALEHHFLYEIVQLTSSIRDPMTTSMGSAPINVEQYYTQPEHLHYQSMIEECLQIKTGSSTTQTQQSSTVRKLNAALAYKVPVALINSEESLEERQKNTHDQSKSSGRQILSQQQQPSILGKMFVWK
jgi:hypothetical protein